MLPEDCVQEAKNAEYQEQDTDTSYEPLETPTNERSIPSEADHDYPYDGQPSQVAEGRHSMTPILSYLSHGLPCPTNLPQRASMPRDEARSAGETNEGRLGHFPPWSCLIR